MIYPTIIFWGNAVALVLVLISFFIILMTRKYAKDSLALNVNGIAFGLFLFWLVLVINQLRYFDTYFNNYVSSYAPWLSSVLPGLTGNVNLIILTLSAICLLIGGITLRNNLQS